MFQCSNLHRNAQVYKYQELILNFYCKAEWISFVSYSVDENFKLSNQKEYPLAI